MMLFPNWSVSQIAGVLRGQTRLFHAQRYAAEVRARNPQMHVPKRVREGYLIAYAWLRGAKP